MASRRFISVPATVVTLVAWLALLPIWIPVTIVVDLLSRLRRLPTLRLGLFAGLYLVHQMIAIGGAIVLWRPGRRFNLRAHRDLQGWWINSLLGWARRLLGVRFDLDDLNVFPSSTFVVLSRHASPVDAVIPAWIIVHQLGRWTHYVLKREMLRDPAMDLIGTRLNNHFVTRSGDTDQEAAAIEAMTVHAEPDAGLTIFPEGTYATAQSRQRIRASLERRGETEVLERANELTTLLPIRPSGTLAMLRGAPDADVMVMGHLGLEGVAQFRGLRRRLPLSDPITVRWWRHQRHELPTSGPETVEWLNERWLELDRWVTANRYVDPD